MYMSYVNSVYERRVCMCVNEVCVCDVCVWCECDICVWCVCVCDAYDWCAMCVWCV